MTSLSKKRQSRRAPVHFELTVWHCAPDLHSQHPVAVGERGGDGQQYREARVALPLRHSQLPVL